MDLRRTLFIAIASVACLLPVSVRAQSGLIEPIPASAYGTAILPDWKTLLRFNYTGGQGVGFQDDFASLGVFQPLVDDGAQLWYFDARGALFTNRSIADQGTSAEGNIGLGLRQPSSTGYGLVGFNLWYDVSNQYRNTYQQVGVGVEYFGPRFDWNANFYIPVGRRNHLVSDTGLLAPIFVGNNAIFPRTRIEEQSLAGYDIEAGTYLLGDFDSRHLRGYIGGYYYRGSNIAGAVGMSGRLVAQVTPDLSLFAQVTHDAIFDTNAAFGLTWLLPGGCRSCHGRGCSSCGSGHATQYSVVNGQSPDQLEYDRYRPVHRNPHIAVHDAVRSLPETATDPNTGQPFDFIHVSSNAAAGGDGTVEMPFMTLAEAQAAAMSGNIVFAHADSVFNAQSIVLPQNVRFLGEGLPHTFNTVQLGVQLIPRATMGTDLPIIQNSVGNAITVMSGDEVAGFTIKNAGLAAIFADSVAGTVNVHDNTFMGGTLGASLVNSTGTFNFSNNTFTNSTGTAFNIAGGAPTVTQTGTITNNSGRAIAIANTTGGSATFNGTVTDDGGNGILVQNSAGNVTVNGATLSNSTANAIDLLNNTGTIALNNTVVTNPTGIGLNVDGGTATVTHTGAITNSSNRAVRVANTTGGSVTTTGPITDNGGEGILVDNVAGAVAISNATLNNSVGNAVDIRDSSGNISIATTTINSPTVDGVDVVNSNANLNGLTINNVGGNGIEVTNQAVARQVTLAGNTINGAGTEGIELNVAGAGMLTATVTGNNVTATGNAFDAATSAGGGPLRLVFNTNTLNSANGAGALIDGSAGGLLTITSFSGNTVTNAMTGGMLVESATFDGNTSVAGIQNVIGGNTAIGALASRVTGDGLRLNQVLGSLSFGDLNVFNDMGTGLFIRDAGGKGGTFNFITTGGAINTTNGPAMDIDPVVLNVALANVSSTNSATNGILLDTVAGTMTIGTTTLTDSAGSGLVLRNSNGFRGNFGTTNIMGTGVAGGMVGHGLELVNNPNAVVTFSSLDVMTDNGTGLLATNSGTINLVTPATVKAFGGPVLDLTTTNGQSNGAAGWTFASLMSTNSTTQGLHLNNLPSPFSVTGGSTIDNAAGIGLEIDGGTAGIAFNTVDIKNRNNTGIDIDGGNQAITFGTTTIDNPNNSGTTALNIANTAGGSVAFSQLTINNNDTAADGVVLADNAATVNIQGGSIRGAGGSAATPGTAVRVDGGTADVTVAANITNDAGRAVDIVNRTRNTVRFTGAINDAGAGTGINIQNQTGSTAKNQVLFDGPVNLGTAASRLTGGPALSVDNGGEPAGNAVVSFANLNVFTNTQPAVVAANGGTLRIGNGVIDTTGAGATGLRLDNLETDITLSRITINNTGLTVAAIDIDDLTGKVFVTGTTTIGGTGLVGSGVDIRNGSADITFTTLNIANNGGTSLFTDSMNGLLTIGAGTLDNGAGTAVSITDTGLAVVLTSVSSAGGATGISLVNTTGMFAANGGSIQNTTADGILLNNANGVMLKSLAISNTGDDGVGFLGNSRNITLDGLNISSTMGEGIEVFSGSNLVFKNNVINSTGQAGIELQSGIDSVLISGGTITNPGARGIELVSVTNVTVQNVVLNGPGGAHITAGADEADNGADGNGIDVQNSVGIVLNGNTIQGFNNSGIHVLSLPSQVVRVTIENNNIFDTGQNFNPAAGTPAWDGISLNVTHPSSRIFIFGTGNNVVQRSRDQDFSRVATGGADVDQTIFGQIQVNGSLEP